MSKLTDQMLGACALLLLFSVGAYLMFCCCITFYVLSMRTVAQVLHLAGCCSSALIPPQNIVMFQALVCKVNYIVQIIYHYSTTKTSLDQYIESHTLF